MPATIRTTTSGRFTFRLVPAGEAILFHGMRNDFSREPASYEQGQAIVEIYDTDYAGKPGFTEYGQLTGHYSAAAMAERTPGVGLMVHGGVPKWTLTPAETAELADFCRPQPRCPICHAANVPVADQAPCDCFVPGTRRLTRSAAVLRQRARIVAGSTSAGTLDAYEHAVRALEGEVLAKVLREIAGNPGYSLGQMDEATLLRVADEIEAYRA